ncbi:hypothetical protein B0H12DRAFT_1101869 [Mycena haematopus]|nr:hypothetical protein B0H12DRAFT_1101869 [Mycena haematopus]
MIASILHTRPKIGLVPSNSASHTESAYGSLITNSLSPADSTAKTVALSAPLTVTRWLLASLTVIHWPVPRFWKTYLSALSSVRSQIPKSPGGAAASPTSTSRGGVPEKVSTGFRLATLVIRTGTGALRATSVLEGKMPSAARGLGEACTSELSANRVKETGRKSILSLTQ